MVAVAERVPAARIAGRVSATVLDLAVVLGLVVLAVGLRLPYLWDVPRFTDELQEVLWAMAIARGEILPLTAVDSYYGPLWSYLLAGGFRLLGPSDWLPRALAMLFASATVGLTYLIGRDMAGRWVGLTAAGLMVTSGGHIIITSHTARANSLTPLLIALVVWCLFRAGRTGSGGPVAAAGFLFALALQTHVSVIALMPGLALGLVLMRPRLLVSPWLALAVGLFVLGYGNMIVYNLQTGFWSFVHARQLQEGYTGGRPTDLAIYSQNFAALVQSLSRLLSGTIDVPTSAARFVYTALAGLGLFLAARGGNPLPLSLCLSAALVLPYFNPRYGPILSGRYLVPMLPFAFLGVALAVGWLFRRLPSDRSRLRDIEVLAVSLAIVLFPLVPLQSYYQEVLEDGRTNRPLYELTNAVSTGYQPGQVVLLDEALAQEQLTAGGTDLKAMRFLLGARSIPERVAKVGPDGSVIDERVEPGWLLVADVKKRPALERRYRVTPISEEIESASGSGHHFAVYRLAPRA